MADGTKTGSETATGSGTKTGSEKVKLVKNGVTVFRTEKEATAKEKAGWKRA
ncbi:MAG: hypothetical protein PQJ60_10710 [Spirochaetales bacterium]|nr:hypothetical protein [Spirochaetales bacterium]